MTDFPGRTPPIPDSRWRQSLRRKLLAWFQKGKRDLPWRRSKDAYRVWLSEIMLQQTQVVTVIPYFERFVARFPTVSHLAAAEESEVLRLWEGLGYYRRARQLHAAARQIVADHGSRFPGTFESIREMPGVGRYTAGAIASIAYDLRAPILEANTIRLFSRLLAYRGDTASVEGQRLLWEFAETILPHKGSGDVNQALMELGSLICTPRDPRCQGCPVQSLCPTFAGDLQQQIPAAKRKQKFEDVNEAAIVIRRSDRVLVRQCPPGERWAGLWDFVRFPLIAPLGRSRSMEISRKVNEQVGMRIALGPHLTTLRHGVTRFRITLDCYLAVHRTGNHDEHEGAPLRWLTPSELTHYPLSTTGRKLAKLLLKSTVPV